MEKEVVAVELHLHSDQGFQYTSRAYFHLIQEYGITPSMSRRGNPYDNAMAENFFSILKTECIYRQNIQTFAQAHELIDDYIHLSKNGISWRKSTILYDWLSFSVSICSGAGRC
jgi:Transposase and inactivated derivatives